MNVRLRHCGLACALALLGGAAAPGTAHAVTGKEIAAQLGAGLVVLLHDETIEGPLDLTGTDTVARVFRCRDCTFRGAVSAPDVTFARTIDLSGSEFQQKVNFRGATFQGPALFAGTPRSESNAKRDPCSSKNERDQRPAFFRARADFALAVFDDPAGFAGSRFCDEALFVETRFSDSTFSRAEFETATFDGASFRGATLFTGAVFKGGASFGDADFRRRSDFSLAGFKDGADFTRAQFGERASFLAATFSSASDGAVTFQSAAASDDLDFTFAFFTVDRIVFSHLVSARALVLRDATLSDIKMAMDRLQVRDLVMDVGDAAHVDDEDDRRTILDTIEESAKTRGDIATANDAHYALETARAKDYGFVRHWLDLIFYRGIAGYFVRPGRPLLVLLLFATVVALVRTRKTGPTESPPSRFRRLRYGGRRCGDLVSCLLDTLSLAGPSWGRNRPPEPPPLRRRLEIITYRLLLVCTLLGLANSNPTLRQMVDTLF